MDKIDLSDLRNNFEYAAYNGQMLQLRKMAIEKYGADDVAMMSNIDVCNKFKEEGYVPMTIKLENGICDSEKIFLFKEEDLEKAIVLYR